MSLKAYFVLPGTVGRRSRRVASAGIVTAVLTAGTLVGVAFTAVPASATTPNPTPSAGVRPGATLLPFHISSAATLAVDVATGNAFYTQQVMTLPGRTDDVPISLSYNSSVQGSTVPSAVTGSNGSGWVISGFDERMVTNADSSVTFYGPGGLSGVFTSTGGGTFASPPQFKATLTGTASAYTLTDHQSQEKLAFNSSGRLTTDTDRNGNVTTYAYNASGDPASITSSRGPSAGRVVTVTTSSHRITQLTQTSGGMTRSVQLTYSANGNLRDIIDADSNYTDIFSPPGTDTAQVVTISPPVSSNIYTRLGFTGSQVTSVAQDNPASDGGAGTSTTRLAYSTGQTLVADPTTNQSSAVSAVPHTTYAINAALLVSSATDADGNSTSATYTPFGDTATSTNGSNGQTTLSYPTGTNGGESLTSIKSPGGATSTDNYTNTGPKAYLPSSQTDDAGSKLTYTYDTNGNQTGAAQGASGPTAAVTYNSDGTPATSSTPGAAAGVTTSYSYANGDGDLTGITPPSGNSLGARSYTWDGFGRLHSATDGAGHTTTYTYDPNDNLVNIAYSDSTTAVGYTYDLNGNITKRTDSSGTTTYSYDDLGNLLSTQNSANGNTVTYTYDLAGRLATVHDALGTTSYSYDAAGLLQYMTYPQLNGSNPPDILATYFSNNSNGQRTDVWMQSNSTHSQWAAHEHFTYDTSGRIIGVLGQNGPATGPTTVENETICFAAGVAPTSCTNPATTADRSNIQSTYESVSGETNTYTYDDHNRLTKDVVTGGTNPRTYTYGYDNAGNRTSSTVTGTSPSSQTLTYNSANQISTSGYTYNGAGDLTTSPARSATFNAAGQQKSATVSGSTSTYTYAGSDDEEVLTESVPGDRTYTLTYGRDDANGQPVIDSVNAAGVGTGYVFSDPSGQPVMLGTSSGVTCLYLYDGIHNPVGLSASTASTAQAFRYDPYGGSTTTNNTGYASAYQNPYTFGEGILDRATGEVKFGQRFYSPKTGNWTQQDSLNAPLDPDNANRYEYAGDNPINLTDPDGNCILCHIKNAYKKIRKTAKKVATVVAGAVGGYAGYQANEYCNENYPGHRPSCGEFAAIVTFDTEQIVDKALGG